MPKGAARKISAKTENYRYASATAQQCVIPSGEAIGVKLYTDGVFVVGTGAVTDPDGAIRSPAKNAGVLCGDRIVAVNGTSVTDNNSLKRLINSGNGHITLRIVRGDNTLEIPVEAAYSEDADEYLIGLWVRDSAAGIGTLTFYNPENSTFAALGHGICDYDTDVLLSAASGSVGDCRICGVIKSENGAPGELLGEFSASKIGNIVTNTEIGIYGTVDKTPALPPVPVATRFETQEGYAQLLCDIDGGGARAYDIEITKVSHSAKPSGKSFVFKICDRRLLEKTGGIVQGMSGSPIIQNGRLVGAVTHVFVNDASRGYGIFAENMLDMTNAMGKN